MPGPFSANAPSFPILPERQGSNRANIRAGMTQGQNGPRYFLSFNTFIRGPQQEEVTTASGSTVKRYKSVGNAQVTVWFSHADQWQAAIDAAIRADEVCVPNFKIVNMATFKRSQPGANGEEYGASLQIEAFPWELYFHMKPRRFADNAVHFTSPQARAAYDADYSGGSGYVPPQVLGNAGAGDSASRGGQTQSAPAGGGGDPMAQDLNVDLGSLDGLDAFDVSGLGNLDDLGDLGDLGGDEIGAPQQRRRSS